MSEAPEKIRARAALVTHSGESKRTFAYADPPYLGQAIRHYKRGGTARRKVSVDPDAAEVDHAALIADLVRKYPDGWALSCSSPSLRVLLPLCPERVRVAAWVKPFAVFKPNVYPAYCWEPVIFAGGRKPGRGTPTLRDYVSVPINPRSGFIGRKPEAFCFWLFELLGAREGDDLVDLFPGSGAVTEAWEKWRAQLRLAV